jgi:hypothetical protein
MGDSPLILKCEAQVYALAGNPAVHPDATRLILEAGRPKIPAMQAAEAVVLKSRLMSGRRSNPMNPIWSGDARLAKTILA